MCKVNKQFYWTTVNVSDVKSYAVLLDYSRLLLIQKIDSFIGLVTILVSDAKS